MSETLSNKATSVEEAEQITPRAEFRVFGQGIIDIVGNSMWNAQAKLFKIRQSTEVYILSRYTNEANVKIRDGLLDIKTKIGETKEGYEIFQPRGKFQFPVKKEELAVILENLKVAISPDKPNYSLEEFLGLVDAHPDLTAVDVEKERYGFSVDGVSEDYAALEEVIDKLEITDFENTNYLIAAKRVVKI
jgi:hypothetical protein